MQAIETQGKGYHNPQGIEFGNQSGRNLYLRRNAVHVAAMSGSINIVKFIVDQLSENLTSQDIIWRGTRRILMQQRHYENVVSCRKKKAVIGKEDLTPQTFSPPSLSSSIGSIPHMFVGWLGNVLL